MTPVFACPRCRGPLIQKGAGRLDCPADGLTFERRDGIWRFLLPERTAHFDRFIVEYAHVRRGEGRRADDGAYYRALPYTDLTGLRRGEWAIRAAGFRALLTHVVEPLETGGSLRILDLGAGNGWLSGRLAARGHALSAVDLQTNSDDGLGAHIHYQPSFTPIQAEFDHLPFAAGQFDLAIFNASFHYSENYEATLAAVLPVLKPAGMLAILDTPIYHDPTSGEAMVRERHTQFESAYGTRSDALASENFLTFTRLEVLALQTGRMFHVYRPRHSIAWRLRPWWARLRRLREPAQFLLLTLK